MTTRPTLKMRLSNKPDAHQAMRVLNQWAAERKRSQQVANAVLLYAALANGDASLIGKFFPGYAMGSAFARPAVERRTYSAPAAVEYVSQSEDEQLSDALDLLGELDLGE